MLDPASWLCPVGHTAAVQGVDRERAGSERQLAMSVAVMTNPTVDAATLHAGEAWYHREKFRYRRVHPQPKVKVSVHRASQNRLQDLVVRPFDGIFGVYPKRRSHVTK